MKKIKVAIVHDWLPFMGGAEKVLECMHELFPDAPIYTTLSNTASLSQKLQQAKIITSSIQKKNKTIKNHRNKFPFMPTAIENFDLKDYDIVLSSSSSVAKSVITSPDTMHICYCHTPMRYGWEFMREYIDDMKIDKSIINKLKNYLMSYMRVWDYSSAGRVDYFVCNSINVAKRVKKHYNVESTVIYPPVDGKRFEISNNVEDYYLCVSRLQEYKRVDLAVKACTKLNVPLVVIGDGPEKENIRKIAGPKVKLLGRMENEVIQEYYRKCKAFIFPGEEDFGITPLEAQASGRPVIAYGKGGALETVIEGKTGVFFYEQTVDSLIEAIKSAENISFIPDELRAHALEFDNEVFKDRLYRFVMEKYEKFTQDKYGNIVVYK